MSSIIHTPGPSPMTAVTWGIERDVTVMNKIDSTGKVIDVKSLRASPHANVRWDRQLPLQGQAR